MQEQRLDGTEVLKDAADMKAVEAALKDKQVTAVHVYKPGEVVTMKSGAKYRIGRRGNWIRVS